MNVLIADIGGTNARFAFIENNRITVHKTLLVRDYDHMHLAIDFFLSSCGLRQPGVFAFALACPVFDDVVKLTNSHWVIDKRAIQRDYNLDKLLIINDFTALAHAVPFLTEDSVIQIGGDSNARGNLAILGAGTGLGVSAVVYQHDSYSILEGEGGHVGFAPCNEQEMRLYQFMQTTYPRVSMERLLQGQGILRIYQSLCQLDGTKPVWTTPEEVSRAAIDNTCHNSRQTLAVYCGMLGSFTGDLVLAFGARGGAYIGGGIVSNFADFIVSSDFRKRFEDKGRLQHYMEDVPVYLITADIPAFAGIVRALEHDVSTSSC